MNSAVDLVRRLHQHRAWVNENLLAAAAEVREDDLKKAFEIGQGSVWKSLLHMYAAEFVWLGALQGHDSAVAPGDLPGRLPGNQLGEHAIASLAELRNRWTELAQRYSVYLAALTEPALAEPVYRVSTSIGAGQRLNTKRSDVLLHVCLHAHYTAAQVVNMLRHLGASKLPETMLIALARSEAMK